MNNWKLYIDDERIPKTEGWYIARSVQSAIHLVKEYGMPSYISFDHDLGGDETSMQFIKWLVDELLDGRLKVPENFEYNVHSANPVGKDNITCLMDGIIGNMDNA